MATRRSFNRIKKYIEEGGIFVNTSGLAFYYMWDSNAGRNFITAEQLETYQMREENILFPVELGGQTSVSPTWMNKNFNNKTTIGAEREGLGLYQNEVDVEHFPQINLKCYHASKPIRYFYGLF
ncbi:MAG TPA: hypothetical protein VH500_08290 [Nitrososphaeraceae archaeon]